MDIWIGVKSPTHILLNGVISRQKGEKQNKYIKSIHRKIVTLIEAN